MRTHLNHVDNLHLIVEDEGVEAGEKVLLEHGRRRQNHVLNVLNSVGLVDLGDEVVVVDVGYVAEVRLSLEVLAMLDALRGVGAGRFVLEHSNRVHNQLVAEQHLEERVLVQHEHHLESGDRVNSGDARGHARGQGWRGKLLLTNETIKTRSKIILMVLIIYIRI